MQPGWYNYVECALMGSARLYRPSKGDNRHTMATILVVDDERPIVEAIDYSLRKEGYETLRAYDAEECMSQARQQPPDLVVLDIMMPSGNGYDLCRQLRKAHGDIPVL